MIVFGHLDHRQLCPRAVLSGALHQGGTLHCKAHQISAVCACCCHDPAQQLICNAPYLQQPHRVTCTQQTASCHQHHEGASRAASNTGAASYARFSHAHLALCSFCGAYSYSCSSESPGVIIVVQLPCITRMHSQGCTQTQTFGTSSAPQITCAVHGRRQRAAP